ncbi:MAG: SPOR domain-containing protein [Alphaproteobacteria bacterium]|nr:SPOR domain-containing protein [Alphaproteobacteria bacterium]
MIPDRDERYGGPRDRATPDSYINISREAFLSDDPEDDEEEDHPSVKRSPLAIVIGILIGVGVAGGIGWYAYSRIMPKTVPKGSEIPLIKAETDRIKVKPENPGGMDVPNRDKLIYQQMGEGNLPPEEERLLPAAESPLKPPEAKVPPPLVAVPAPASPARVAETVPPVVKANEAPLSHRSVGTAPLENGGVSVPVPPLRTAVPPVAASTPMAIAPLVAPIGVAPVPPPMAPVTVASHHAPAAETQATEAQHSAPSAAATKPHPPAKVANVPAPAPAPVAPPAKGGADLAGVKVQLGSLRAADLAEKTWEHMASRNGDLLGGLKHKVVQVDLGEKGIYYRIYAGPLSDVDAAKTLCSGLEQRKIGCMIVKK